MTGFKHLVLSCCLVCFDTLLSEADGFDLSTAFGYDYVGFGWVVWCAFWFIIAANACSC